MTPEPAQTSFVLFLTQRLLYCSPFFLLQFCRFAVLQFCSFASLRDAKRPSGAHRALALCSCSSAVAVPQLQFRSCSSAVAVPQLQFRSCSFAVAVTPPKLHRFSRSVSVTEPSILSNTFATATPTHAQVFCTATGVADQHRHPSDASDHQCTPRNCPQTRQSPSRPQTPECASRCDPRTIDRG
jgi:hypothetical protein